MFKQLLLTVVTAVVAQSRLKNQSANLEGGSAAPALQWAAALRVKQRIRTIESYNYRLIWAGKDLKAHLIPNPLLREGTGLELGFHQTRLLRAPDGSSLIHPVSLRHTSPLVESITGHLNP